MLWPSECVMAVKAPYSTASLNRKGNKNLQVQLDEDFLRLEEELDTIPGKTAAMLRLERFSAWYGQKAYNRPSYLAEIDRLNVKKLGQWVHRVDMDKVKWRYRLLHTFNPLSAKMPIVRFVRNEWEMSITPTEFLKRFPNEGLGGWTPEQWERYCSRDVRHGNRKRDRAEREKDRQAERKSRVATSADEEEEVVLVDRWSVDEWHRY